MGGSSGLQRTLSAPAKSFRLAKPPCADPSSLKPSSKRPPVPPFKFVYCCGRLTQLRSQVCQTRQARLLRLRFATLSRAS